MTGSYLFVEQTNAVRGGWGNIYHKNGGVWTLYSMVMIRGHVLFLNSVQLDVFP